MATQAETRDLAGNELGMLRLGQSLQAQDATRIETARTQVYAQLKKDGHAIWASTAAIPDELVPHVVALIAENCLGTYGVSTERYQRIKSSAVVARREIPKLTAPDYVSQDSATDY